MTMRATALLCLVPAVLVNGNEGLEGLASMLSGGGGGGGADLGAMMGNLFSGGGLSVEMSGDDLGF